MTGATQFKIELFQFTEMDRPRKPFQNPFYRPYDNNMAASPQQEPSGIVKYLPKSKAFKGIIAGGFVIVLKVHTLKVKVLKYV